MPRNSISVTATQTTEVALSGRARVMLQERVEEHTKLAKAIKDAKARQKRIETEVDTLFTREGQGEALFNGTDINGYKLKVVCGSTRTLDKQALMRAHGLDQADLDACTTEKPNKEYIKITPPGGKDEDES